MCKIWNKGGTKLKKFKKNPDKLKPEGVIVKCKLSVAKFYWIDVKFESITGAVWLNSDLDF